MNPTILVIIGATGDLTHRKIIPALASLYDAKALPERFRVLGFSRRDLSDQEFRNHTENTFADEEKAPESGFLNMFEYQQGFFDKKEDYEKLATRLQKIDAEWGMCTNKLFYLAVPPELYERIATHLATGGLTIPCGGESGWTRIIVEKPFGSDTKTARELDVLLRKLFKEEQIYRIDHYLGKEMMQNILAFRFANNLFEPSWNNHHIESIAVRFMETLGLEGRGGFYDTAGALRDVGQNHLLQMMALTMMDNPEKMDAQTVRRNRTAILGSLKKFRESDVVTNSVRGQYIGYRQEKGVALDSETETYFKVTALLNSSRWEGIPITLESGKCMPEICKEIEVVFKHPAPCLCPPGLHYKNSVTFQIEPKEMVRVRFWAKKPGLASMQMEEKDFKFEMEKSDGPKGKGGYEKLLMDCIMGDQTLFVSSDEVAASWEFIDTIIEGWKNELSPLHRYQPGELPEIKMK